MGPGQIAFARMPWRPSSQARLWVRLMIAALAPSRSRAKTRAPSPARRSTQAAPMPSAPPETMAVCRQSAGGRSAWDGSDFRELAFGVEEGHGHDLTRNRFFTEPDRDTLPH